MKTHTESPPAGHVEPGFEAVRTAFAENFSRLHELGGACCLFYRGRSGSFGFADPRNAVSYGYVTSRMGANLTGDPRDLALRRAAYAIVEAQSGSAASS